MNSQNSEIDRLVPKLMSNYKAWSKAIANPAKEFPLTPLPIISGQIPIELHRLKNSFVSIVIDSNRKSNLLIYISTQVQYKKV